MVFLTWSKGILQRGTQRRGRGEETGAAHTDGADEHRDHREPGVGEALRRAPAVADAQHVRERLEQRPRVLLQPRLLLQHHVVCMYSTVRYSSSERWTGGPAIMSYDSVPTRSSSMITQQSSGRSRNVGTRNCRHAFLQESFRTGQYKSMTVTHWIHVVHASTSIHILRTSRTRVPVCTICP